MDEIQTSSLPPVQPWTSYLELWGERRRWGGVVEAESGVGVLEGVENGERIGGEIGVVGAF